MLHSRQRFEQWLPASFDGLFDWDFLKPAFAPTKIEPMDFDAVIERNGHVLIFETKDVGVELKLGPIITLTDQWKKGATIFHVIGKTPKEIQGYALYWEGAHQQGQSFGCVPIREGTWIDVLFHTHRWFCRADNRQAPTREAWERKIWLSDFTDGPTGIPGMDVERKVEAPID